MGGDLLQPHLVGHRDVVGEHQHVASGVEGIHGFGERMWARHGDQCEGGSDVAGDAADCSGRHFVRAARLSNQRPGGKLLLGQVDRDVDRRHVRCPNRDQQVVGRGVRHGEAEEVLRLQR